MKETSWEMSAELYTSFGTHGSVHRRWFSRTRCSVV